MIRKRLTAYYRLTMFAFKILKNRVALGQMHWGQGGQQSHLVFQNRMALANQLIRLLGLKVHATGNATEGQKIFVCNHRSYLDPLFIVNQHPCLAVSKAEIKKWPVIGKYAERTGTLFVDREQKKDRLVTLVQLRRALENGYSILIYPEGTSHNNISTYPFHKGIFSLASKYQVPVIPVSVNYKEEGMCFIGDDTFLPHFLKNFQRSSTCVYIHFGAPIFNSDAEELRTVTQSEIDYQLQKSNCYS